MFTTRRFLTLDPARPSGLRRRRFQFRRPPRRNISQSSGRINRHGKRCARAGGELTRATWPTFCHRNALRLPALPPPQVKKIRYHEALENNSALSSLAGAMRSEQVNRRVVELGQPNRRARCGEHASRGRADVGRCRAGQFKKWQVAFPAPRPRFVVTNLSQNFS